MGGAQREFFLCSLREASKNKVLLLMAGKLRGGGGKGQVIKEKNNFFWNFFFKLCCHLKIIFFYLSKYVNMMLKFVGRYFIWVVTIFSKKWGH